MKRFLTLALAVMMFVSVLPATVFAAETTVTLRGSFDNWTTGLELTGDGTTVSGTLNLSAGKYEFKITEGEKWLGNSGTIVGSADGWEMSSSNGSNCKLITGEGAYTFTFDTTTKKLSVTGPAVPMVTLYLVNSSSWEKPTAHCWVENGDNDYGVTTWPGYEMSNVSGNVWSVNVPVACDRIIFSNNGATQTADLTIPTDDKIIYNGTQWVTCAHETYENGKCTICGTACAHDSHNTDGKCTVCGTDVEHTYVDGACFCGATDPDYITPVAEDADGNKYTDLADAIAVGGNIKLLADVTLTEAIEITNKAVTITADKAVTITANDVQDAFQAGTNGTLTLGANLNITSNQPILWANGGTIIIDGASVTAKGCRGLAYAGDGSGSENGSGTITVKAGKVSLEDYNELTISAYGKNAVVNIEGGVVTSNASTAIAVLNGAKLNIRGGEVKSTCEDTEYVAAYARNASIEMTGGTVTSQNGYGLAAASGGTVTVKGGIVNGGVKANEAGATVTIEGGSFTMNNTKNHTVWADGDDKLTVSGGTFDLAVPEEYCAEGYIPTKNADNTYGVKAGQYVAQVGQTKYETLAEAVAAANTGDTVNVLGDVTLTEAIEITNKAVTITADKAVTITANDVQDAFQAGTNGTLTLGANLNITSNQPILWANGGTIIIDGASVTAKGCRGLAYAGDGSGSENGSGTITVKAGKVSLEDYNELTISAYGKNAVVNIEGGVVTSNASTAIAVLNGAKLNIRGGEVKSTCEDTEYVAAYARNASIEMTDGTVTSQNGYGLAAASGGTVTVKGGTVNGGVKANEAGATVTIEGGNFTKNVTKDHTVWADGEDKLTVSGGTFDLAVPEEYCAEGYAPVDLGNGTYGVELGVVVNTRTLNYYSTIANALAAASEGDTLKLLDDHEESMVELTKGVSLDLNGKTLTADYVVVFKGSNLIDGNTEKGLLKVARDNILLPANNAQMPVWNAADGYIFTAVNLSYEEMVSEEGYVFKSKFKPSFGKLGNEKQSIAKTYFVDEKGASDNGLKIILRLSWETDSGKVTHEFTYLDTLVQTVYKDAESKTFFTLSVTSLASDAAVSVQVVVVSDTGVETVSEGLTYPAN